MSTKASPTTIGVFVLGAITLLLVGIVVFGSGKFLTDQFRVVMYFEGSLKGLNSGASVDLEGVHIGTVVDIGVLIDTSDFSVHSFVVVDINRTNLRMRDDNQLSPQGHKIKIMVEKKGLRAQLQLESMVTGQLFVQLAFYPDSSPQQLIVDPLTNLPEIPTIPSTLQQMEGTLNKALTKISNVPLEQIMINLNRTLQGIDTLVNAPAVIELFHNLNNTLSHVQGLVHNIDKQILPLTTNAISTLTNVTNATGDISKLSRHADSAVMALTNSLPKTMLTVQNTLETAQAALKNFNSMMEPNSPLGYEVMQTLRQLSEAARTLRVLADYLERHPNAVLFGKPEVTVR